MLLVAPVRADRRVAANPTAAHGLAQVNEPRSVIPAVTHVDYSARIQTVDVARNPRLHQLLTAFDRQTGCPVLINTSFNVRGEPIVGSPDDAYRCFMATNMDVLVIGNFVVLKSEQPESARVNAQEYLSKYEKD